jgi:Cu/Ag efflux protein CusF
MIIDGVGKRVYLTGIFLALTVGATAMDQERKDVQAAGKSAAPAQRSNIAKAAVPVGIFQGVGFVTSVEPAGSLTINHQPIEGLMPAMEMMFTVNPRTLAKGVHPGDKIAFNVEGKTYVIVGLKVIEHTP